jgi:integrase
MSDMPRPRPPHLHAETTRHGARVWYVRKGTGPRIRIRGVYGSPEFMTAYQAAIAGEAAESVTSRTHVGSLRWLFDRYRETTAWRDLSMATRKQREAIFRKVLDKAGTIPATQITRAVIIDSRDARRATPAQARHFIVAMRGLFRWAADAGHVAADPTTGVKSPKRSEGPGFAIWTEDEIAAFEARWPIGTRPRVAFDLLRYTGLRRGDAVRVGRPHVSDCVISIRTEKTGIWVTLPILPALAATLEAGPVGDLTFIAGERGRPMVKESFGTWFRECCRAAGVTKSAHGIRKVSATTAAENGATEADLDSLFGWKRGSGISATYTREASRARISTAAITKLQRNKT